MRILFNIGDILGAIVSSKMTGDLRAHSAWTLKLLALLTAVAYLIVRH